MKILALVTDAFGAAGGIAQYNRDFLGALARNEGISSIVVLPRGGQAENLNLPVKIEQVDARPGRIGYALAAFRLAVRSRPDLVFCGHLFLLPACWVAAKSIGVPIWLQLHGVEAWQKPPRIRDWMLRSLSLVTAVSRYSRRRFLSWAPCEPSQVRVLPNTVSEDFGPGDRDAAQCRLGLTGTPLLLSVGRLSASERYKGHDRVLRCLPGLLKRFPDLRYIVAGDGDDQQRLQALTIELDVNAAVDFRGAVSKQELQTLYQAVDIFVMPSSGEGFGIVFLEAMASGTTALGLDADGSRDPLRDGDLGIVTSEADLCESIVRALEQTKEKGLPERVSAFFGPSAFEQQVARLFEQLQKGGETPVTPRPPALIPN